jgi:hypothetical protein
VMMDDVVARRRRQRGCGTIGYVGSLPLCWNFSFDVLECFSPIGMKILMAKSPALRRKK